jgi:metallo-beta-lactamase class B
MKRRIECTPPWVAGLLAALTLAPGLARGEEARTPEIGAPVQVDPDLRVRPLAEGVWLHTSATTLENFGRTEGNGIVVVTGRRAVLVDTPWTDRLTGILFDWVKKELKAEITDVVPTHSHADCMGGLAEAHRRGARSLSLSKTVEIAREHGLEIPQHAFDGATKLEIEGTTFEIFYPGPGHTVDNFVVYLPAQKLLFGGCLVKCAAARTLGYTREANLEAWPGTLETVREKYPDAILVVPGHGPPGPLSIIDHTRDLLRARASAPTQPKAD